MNPTETATAEHYLWGEGCEGWHLLKRDDLSVIQERVPPGCGEVTHLHQRSRQFFYILSGEATMILGEQAICLKPFQGIEVPPGVPHQFCNHSKTEVVFLVISAPKSHGDREDVFSSNSYGTKH